MKTPLLRLLPALIVLGATTTVLHTSGCAGGPLSRSTGDVVDDATITTKVKTAFARDPVVSAFGVGVDTFKGTVQLNGFVDTAQEKTRAEQIARGIPGVVNVDNKLSVKGQAAR